MKKIKFTIKNELGLHLRPSSKLSQLASKYPCEIWISKDNNKVNAKSVVGITLLAAGKGAELEIEFDGDKENQALSDIENFLSTNFHEES
jgi:phosphocarrier protein